MKNVFLPLLAIVVIISSCTNQKTFTGKLESESDSISYAIGISVGNQLSQDSTIYVINEQAVAQALKDVREGNEEVFTAQEAGMYIQSYMMKKQAKKAETQLKKVEMFLEDNLIKDGIVELEPGLQMRVLKEGTGPSPTAADRVKCHYRGTLMNGDQFDSSYDRNEPATFPLNGVIRGWTIGLQNMKVGGKYELFVHPDLGYGRRGTRNIGPNELLIFEIELLEINPKE